MHACIHTYIHTYPYTLHGSAAALRTSSSKSPPLRREHVDIVLPYNIISTTTTTTNNTNTTTAYIKILYVYIDTAETALGRRPSRPTRARRLERALANYWLYVFVVFLCCSSLLVYSSSNYTHNMNDNDNNDNNNDDTRCYMKYVIVV